MRPDPHANPYTELLDKLPHQHPFRFLSRLLEVTPGENGSAIWSLRGDEAFFQGHFPGDPIVPGVLISEALAQLSGLVGFHGEGPAMGGRLVHIDVRFDNAVRPPADITLQSTRTRVLGQLHQFDVKAFVAETPVARGSLTLAAAPQQSPT
jgi:3-hydroxyacyl-[acyl-carrier-protein] dehydratase